MVLQNNVVVGSVNAKQTTLVQGGAGARESGSRMARSAHHEVRGARWFMRALERQPEDIKVVIQFAEA
jgi:hypothetical protein